MRSKPSVLIIGGGVAGLSSALTHLQAGFRVTLIEKRKQLGGRAWSDAKGLDNGPHVILGCYHHFRKLLRALGTEGLFEKEESLQLTWVFKGGQSLRLRPPKLPSPLHLLAGLIRLDLPLKARICLIKGTLSVRLPLPPPGTTLQDWFVKRKINRDTQSLFFVPLCRAVMNVEADQADARLFLKTLRVAFGASRKEGAIWCPTAPWSQILHRAGALFLEKNRVEWVHASVKALSLSQDKGIDSVTLGNGQKRSSFDRLVLAVPWEEAAKLAPFADFATKAKEIQSSSIVSVSFPPPRQPFPFNEPLLALVGGEPFHFLCKAPSPNGWLTLLAGAADHAQIQTQEAWIEEALKCFQTFFGPGKLLPESPHQSCRVRREARATIASTPRIAGLRPKPGPTEIQGLWLAGDWTDTGFPSTLEGAAKSGAFPA
ncbi:MAG TPA: FAD-dependent oxidoreductase [Planctomycetes bacterium]|nr:FAD-dependent oxidoreductase [Planctomycetota bacterium]